MADGVAVTVGVVERVGIRGLGDHGVFAVFVGGVAEHLGEIRQAAVPAGIIGGGEHIIINIVLCEKIREPFHGAGVLGIGKVHGDSDALVKGANRRSAGLEKRGAVGVLVRAGDAGGDLVADLHHAYGGSRVF